MTTKTRITISLTLDTAAPDPKAVGNNVRRAIDDIVKHNGVLIPGLPVIAKGVTIKTREVKAVTKPSSPIREWAVANGHPEVAGKRGRISKSVIAEYDAAHA